MIEDYRALAVFVAVAEAGSFSAAGRRLKLSTSVVSHHVTKLETKLDAPLFFRSTRSLSLTSEGQVILEVARKMVAAGEEAMDSLSATSEQPAGALRIAVPAFGENTAVHRAIWEFVRRHPLVTISLDSSDEQVDLIKDGYDLAVRLGDLSDSQLKGRRIGRFRRRVVASKAYLAEREPVCSLEDLRKCDFLRYAMLSQKLTLTKGSQSVVFSPERCRLEVNSISAGKAAVLAGLGVLQIPLSEIEMELASGDLVEVLPDWSLQDKSIYAIWPETGLQKKLTRRLLDHLVERCSELND